MSSSKSEGFDGDLAIELIKTDVEADVKLWLVPFLYNFANGPLFADHETNQPELTHEYMKSDEYYVVMQSTKTQQRKPVSTCILVQMTQNVRGRIIECGGISGISVLPEMQRHKLATRMLTHLLNRMHQKRISVSMLHPFSEEFYDKFGFVNLCQRQTCEFKPKQLKGVFTNVDIDKFGSVERGQSDEGFPNFMKVMAVVQQRTAGMIQPSVGRFKTVKDGRFWMATAFDKQHEPIGVLVYRCENQDRIEVECMLYCNDTAKYMLLKFLSLHTSLIKTIQMPMMLENPALWMTDGNVTIVCFILCVSVG